MRPELRTALYVVLIVASLASCLGRVVSVKSKDGRGPFLSANDRSRWSTVRAIVDNNTYVIDRLQNDPQWQTIDKVQHVGRDGKLHFYSSKPPLFPTLLAIPYWIIKNTTGATFQHHPFPVTRFLLVLTNVVPLAIYFWLLARLIERWCQTDWGRIFAISAAAWGTYLTTFVITLNNHLPAAICTLVALHVFIRIWYDGCRQRRYFVAAGLAASFAAANELPALSLVAFLGLALLWKDWKSTVCWGIPAVALVAIPFFGLNYLAHDSLIPPYAHRSAENNWYVYPGSHWLPENRRGIDRGEPSPAIYVVHALVGHHGIFSLTPIWLFSVVGLAMLARRDRQVPMPALAFAIAALSVVCIGFYLLRPEIDRNYGGVTSGFRWVFWFTPLWLFAMLPTLDWMGNSARARILAYVLLAISIVSATYPSANPWQHPWPYQLAQYVGLITSQ